MRLIKFSSLVCFLALLTACSSTELKSPTEAYKGYGAEQLFNSGERKLLKHDYVKAIKFFEALDTIYPFGQYTEQAQLDLIYAYYMQGDYISTVTTTDHFIKLYPRSEHVDYAYYMKAKANLVQGKTYLQRILPIDMSSRDLTTLRQAFVDFRSLNERFPDSYYAADSVQHMIYLRNLFAQHELTVARYYMTRHAFVGAANRANYIVNYYQHTPQTEEALMILVVANRQLGMHQSADEALRVLQTNYPNCKFLPKLMRK